MIPELWIQFLTAKGELVFRHIYGDETRALVERMHVSAMQKLQYFISQGDSRLVSIAKTYDQEIENTMNRHVPDEDIETIRQQLLARFGFVALASTPDAVIKRVLKRGRIKDENEGRVIQELLSSGQTHLSPDDRKKLEDAMGHFEQGSGA